MDTRHTSPTRTKAPWKPRVEGADPRFLPFDGETLLVLDTGRDAAYREPGRSPVAVLPYQVGCGEEAFGGGGEGAAEAAKGREEAADAAVTGLGENREGVTGLGEALPFLAPDQLPAGVELAYAIVGGYDANAVEVRWRIAKGTAGPDGRSVTLRWVMLKTFTGLQVKYPLPGKRPPLVFALADEDAYVYCDEPTCRECTFRCKQGFVLYAAFDGLGIVRLPLSPNRS